ncbi:MAG TPA: acylphosphatase, partial [Methanofastidiosum sp.]|nr:acylphosphatase [Methanofastidiosum sp.]
MKRVRIYVSGLVQGVFYRANAQKEAEMLKVKGYIRNLPDGRVE